MVKKANVFNYNIYRFLFYCILLLFAQKAVYSQFYLTGEPPASVKWQQIKTTNFKIVYPKGLYDEANHYANLLEMNRPLIDSALHHDPKPIPVLIHTTSLLSNGFVVWAPRRMEIVATPPQDAYAQDWLAQLSVHEYRHVVQIDKLNQGFTKVLSFFTGEISVGLVSSMLPAWFFEGDAVTSETVFSHSGRGRVAGFEMPLRTIILGGEKPYSYDKMAFGSYRDFTPDVYQLGYQIVNYGYAKYGNNFWPSLIDYTARNSYLVCPMKFYLWKYGLNKNRLYRQTIDSLTYLYSKKMTDKYIAYKSLQNENSGLYDNYILPQYVNNDSLVTLCTGIDHIDQIVLTDTLGNRKLLCSAGTISQIKLSSSKYMIAWVESVYDPRWTTRDYSEIKTYNLKTGKITRVSRRTRYFSPDLSPDSKSLAVIQIDEKNLCSLLVLDSKSGKIENQIAAQNDEFFETPDWSDKDKVLVISVSSKGKQIVEINIVTGKKTAIYSFTFYDIAEPVAYGNYVLFRSSFNGIENIYAINRLNHNILQVTHAEYGAYHPAISPDSLTMAFSNYTVNGFKIVQIPIDTSKWVKVFVKNQPEPIWTGEDKLNKNIIPAGELADKHYNSIPYNKFTHLLHFHSWLPFYADVTNSNINLNDIKVYPGLTLYSQNLLGSTISSLSYRYINGYNVFEPSVTWRGWYPVFEFSGKFGGPAYLYPIHEGANLPPKINQYTEFTISSYIPLFYNRGKYLWFIQPELDYQYTNTYYSDNTNVIKGIDYLYYRLYLYHYLRSSIRDIYPKWGQLISLNFTQTPSDMKLLGNICSAAGRFYFPGFFKHQSFNVYTGFQSQQLKQYYLSINEVNFPRGYPEEVSAKFFTLDLNYTFPLICPDIAVSWILYLKRIRANLFYDYSKGEDVIQQTSTGVNRYNGDYRSFGTELIADLHLLRFIFPISTGIRIGYKEYNNEIFTQFIFNININ